jgi:hypothetical protein
MDYQKTIELYEKIGQIKKWEDTPESNSYKGEQTWYDKGKGKRTGEFYQVDEFIRREWLPADWKPPTSRYERRTCKISIKACE